MSETDSISATYVQIGVNFGDHGETVRQAIQIDENETIRELMERIIRETPYHQRDYDHYIELQFAKPTDEVLESRRKSSTVVPPF